jgi:hypothetical protein
MSEPLELEDVLDTDEAAELAGKSPEAIRKALQRGSLRGKHIGRSWVTTRAELREWLAWGPVERRRHKGTGRWMGGID